MESNQNFTAGKIYGPLIKFALPVMAALFLQAMYGAIDLIVIGLFGEATDISAVATGSQIMHSITCVITGLAIGITILAGQKIGEKQPEEAGKVVGSGICLFALIGAVLTLLMTLGASPVASLMQAPKEAFHETVTYVRICSAGSLFIVAYNVLGSIFRGIGDSQMPLITVAIACVVNIAGDFLLIGGLHMGVAGAALATVGAQVVSVILSLFIITKRKLPFSFTKASLKLDRALTSHILKLGMPIAFQELLVSISFLVLLAIVNSLGVIASAGMGISEKLVGFIMLVPSAFMQSMSAFVAQNVGAKTFDRAHKALLYGIATSLAIGFVMCYGSFFHGNILAGIFYNGDDMNVIYAAADYLKAYAVDCVFVSFLFCFLGYFNGWGNTMFVMIQGIVGAFVIRIPVAFLMSRIPGVSLFYIGLATPISTVGQIILCLGFYWLKHRRNHDM